MIRPFPKPPPFPKRLPEGSRMTIVLGLRCPANGIVLCADSQESVKEYYKESTRKLQFDSIGGGWAFGYGAAGDGHYCDFVEQQICESLKKLNSFGRDEVKSCIKEKLHLLHERHMWPNPDYYSLR